MHKDAIKYQRMSLEWEKKFFDCVEVYANTNALSSAISFEIADAAVAECRENLGRARQLHKDSYSLTNHGKGDFIKNYDQVNRAAELDAENYETKSVIVAKEKAIKLITEAKQMRNKSK